MVVETLGHVFGSLISSLHVIFLVIHVIFHFDRFLHLLFRFGFPDRAHPEMSDVMPATAADSDYPLVAIQLPMMNEVTCYKSAISCACSFKWPKSRLIVQVLDDSTEEEVKVLIDQCAQGWAAQGFQIYVHRRSDRQGFKAGNLKFGMTFIRDVDYIAIFDVDFLPPADFLYKTVPCLMQDPNVAFVQTRWTFFNAKESFLTRMQEVALNFHHLCEQEGRYRASVLLQFCGTGGIWRRSAIEDVGGWHTDTVTEDLDLSFRVHASGWRAVYLKDVGCLNELPPTLSAYLLQQHR